MAKKRQISWPGHDCETGDLAREAARLANTPASRSKQAARATPKGSLRMLCAQSPISGLYFSLGLSTRTTIFVDLVFVSTESALFVDRTHGEQEFELCPSHKPQGRDTDSHRRRKDLPQSHKAGHQSRTCSEYIVNNQQML